MRADMASQIIRLLKSDELARHTTGSVCLKHFVAAFKRHRLALSIHQSAEWGMGALQQMCWLL
jgi:hypothetical protein